MPPESAKHMRVWPAVALPLGLTLILSVALWLFLSKVGADGERITSGALRLESYARLEAGELARRAGTAAQAFVELRAAERAEQEKNIRVELRGIMEAALRVLEDGLEKTRALADAPRNDVGEFPPGFEGLRVYLELSGPERTADLPVEAMRASIPEIASLVPAGCSLAVIENNVQEILSVGGGALPENVRVESMTREFAWNGGGGDSRRWTLRLSLAEADAYPVPDAAAVAGHLAAQFADTLLDGALWRGWLVDSAGQAAATFPLPAESGSDSPPFINMPGEWVEVDGSRLVWQERAPAVAETGLTPAVAVSIDRPADPPVWHRELRTDTRWSLTLAVLALLSAGMWVWFLRSIALSRRGAKSRRAGAAQAPHAAHAVQQHSARQTAQALQNQALQNALAAAKARSASVPPQASAPASASASAAEQPPRQRLVRDDSVKRAVPDAPRSNIIVADINDDGEVVVEAEEIQAPPPRKRLPMPTGSLLRLQERHRGGKGRQGSRILDQAKSQVLRELARRVRPVIRASSGRQSQNAERPQQHQHHEHG